MRVLADIFTALRLGIAAFIVYAGLRPGREAFGAVTVALLTGWTLDTLDGHLARAASDGEPSWLGSHERQIDAVMIVAGFLYLTLIGIVPVWVCTTYLIVAAMLLLTRWRSAALLTVLEIPMVVLVPVTGFLLDSIWGWAFVVWGLAALILDWRRVQVRLRILWADVQRLRSSGEQETPQASIHGRAKNEP